MKRVVVIGGGFGGAALAIHLARRAAAPLEIVVVEPRPRVGGGLAHSTADPDHRLNAPDVIHGVHPDDPLHFRRWLEETGRLARDPDAWASDGRLYPRRGDFGAYVAAEFERHASANPSASVLRHVRARAAAIARSPRGFHIEVEGQGATEAAACAIALGQEPTRVALPGLDGAARIDAPLAQGALDGVPRAGPVLVLGTGLTAADAVASLVARGHVGPITCLSRRGLRPADQHPAPPKVPLWEHLAADPPDFVARHGTPRSLRALVAIVRRDARERLARGEPWHGAIDDVRDAAGALWQGLAAADRERFLRHTKPWYDSHRFRIPPQTAEILARAERAGALGFAAGRIARVREVRGGVDVTVRPRGAPDQWTRRFAAVLSCAGFAVPVARSRNPFLRSCLEQGLARPSVAGRGLDADAEFRAVGADGAPVPGLHVVGATALDRFGETPAAIFILRQVLSGMPSFLRSL